jgi:hypothetical protein
VDVPLFNLKLPAETVPLGSGAIAVTSDARRERGRFGGPHKDVWAVRRHLNDELTGRSRWLLASTWHDHDIDTRQTASLLLVQEGTDDLATTLAETRAKYALAMWCLLDPPKRTATSRPVWPSAGHWVPAAYIGLGILHKEHEPGVFPTRARRRGALITEFGEHKLTRRTDVLLAPFDAMRHAQKGNQGALALLSASRALYIAGRFPNDLEPTERVMNIWAAREALTDRGRRGQGTADERWDKLVCNLKLRGVLTRRGYGKEEVDDAFETLHLLRDLATHKAEDVLANQNYPDGRTVKLNRAEVDADHIGLALITANIPILYTIVRTAAVRLARQAISSGWDDKLFLSRFVKKTQPRLKGSRRGGTK